MQQKFFITVVMIMSLIGCFDALYSKDIKTADPFVLVTMLYNETDLQRVVEYKTCILKNLAHELIQEIHVLYDTSKDYTDGRNNEIRRFLEHNQIKITEITSRPTYEYIFRFANKEYPNRRVILCNGDIYFNDTLYKLESYTSWRNKLLSLTRWNVQDDYQIIRLEGFGPNTPNTLSADAWIFKTPFLPFVGSDEICMGSYACDHCLAYAAKKSGISIINPCISLQACHLHISQIRHYLDDRAITYAHKVGSAQIEWSYLPGYKDDLIFFNQELARLKTHMDTSILTKQDRFVLFTMLYNEKDPERVKEYKICLLKNKNLESIKKIHVLYDTNADYTDGRPNELFDFLVQEGFTVSIIKGRASYGQFFKEANDLYPNSLIIVANADIYFNQSINKLVSFKDWESTFFALTRWNIQRDGDLYLEGVPGGRPNYSSMDSWIFKTPFNVSAKMHDISMGILGCDSAIAYAAKKEGYTVLNPCGSIQSFHVHLSPVRNHRAEKGYPTPLYVAEWSVLSDFPEDASLLSYEIEKIKSYDSFYSMKK